MALVVQKCPHEDTTGVQRTDDGRASDLHPDGMPGLQLDSIAELFPQAA
jgi:hypothetical protein